MTRRMLTLLLAAALLASPLWLAAAGTAPSARAEEEGKLGKLESALKGGKKSSSSSSLKPSEALLAHLIVEFFVHVAPYLLFPFHRFHYQGYPYEIAEGYLEYYGDTPWSDPAEVPLTAHPVTFEIRGGYLVDSPELQGWRFYGKTRLSWAFNLDVDVTQFKEWRTFPDFDTLTFTKIDGLFNISNSPWHDIDLGFGLSYIDGIDVFGGLNVKLTGDIFPVRPLGIHFSACANGFEGGTLYETEFALGVFIRRFELRLGWRSLWVGDIEIHGPISEVCIWF